MTHDEQTIFVSDSAHLVRWQVQPGKEGQGPTRRVIVDMPVEEGQDDILCEINKQPFRLEMTVAQMNLPQTPPTRPEGPPTRPEGPPTRPEGLLQ